jgi:hypothetical protein
MVQRARVEPKTDRLTGAMQRFCGDFRCRSGPVLGA